MAAEQVSERIHWAAQEDVSRRLMDLYAVGTGLALAIGVERMVRFTGDSDALICWESLPLFVALVATLIPCYHGALRHLYKRWIEAHDGMASSSMMVDFVMLFLGVGVMLAMGYVLTQPFAFAVALMALLLLDCLWALTFDYLVDRRTRRQSTRRWLKMLAPEAARFVRDVATTKKPAAHPSSTGCGSTPGRLPFRYRFSSSSRRAACPRSPWRFRWPSWCSPWRGRYSTTGSTPASTSLSADHAAPTTDVPARVWRRDDGRDGPRVVDRPEPLRDRMGGVSSLGFRTSEVPPGGGHVA